MPALPPAPSRWHSSHTLPALQGRKAGSSLGRAMSRAVLGLGSALSRVWLTQSAVALWKCHYPTFQASTGSSLQSCPPLWPPLSRQHCVWR